MDENRQLSAVVSLVLMVATIALGWLTFSDRLVSGRPPEEGSVALTSSLGEEDVVARLWEDPLQAVQAEIQRQTDKTAAAAEHGVSGLAGSVVRRASGGEPACLLIVSIPGGPYPDDNEIRLRTRYAVQMALAQADYAPADPEHLGYVTLAWPRAGSVHGGVVGSANGPEPGSWWCADEAVAATTNREVSLPYEWFVPRSGGTNQTPLLTLWFPEHLLGDEPLCRLAHLYRSLNAPRGTPATNALKGMLFVGPRASDTLKSMVEDRPSPGGHECFRQLQGRLRIYSPQATAPDALLGLSPRPYWDETRKNLDLKLRNRLGPDGNTNVWHYFRNFIATDDQLTDLLASELSLRGVRFGSSSNDRVLLLAEADTSYGRALPMAFRASVGALETLKFVEASEASEANQAERNGRRVVSQTPLEVAGTDGSTNQSRPDQVMMVRYLRGLDKSKGSSQQGGKASAIRATSVEQALSLALEQRAEMPFGESQLDYAERLARELKETGGGRVKAVGILGSDVYDKLILVQAFRRSFPQALFFTTDLDARLWHPTSQRFTRNLVVASAYGIKADSKVFDMAPFRDVYQRALFQASLAAIQDAGPAGPILGSDDDPPIPGLYELGRHGPVPLRSFADGGEPVRATVRLVAVGIAPVAPGLVVLGVALLLLAFIWSRVDSEVVGQPGRFRMDDLLAARAGWAAWFVVGAAFLACAVAFLARVLAAQPGGEPWRWLEGVSIWPTEIVRLLTFCCVVWMLFQAWQNHRRHTEELWLSYFDRRGKWKHLLEGRRSEPVGVQIRALFARRRQKPAAAPARGEKGEVGARNVFLQYVRKATLPRRIVRSAAGALVYFLMAFSVILLVGGLPLRAMVRGEAARAIDLVVLLTAVGGFLFLVFYVLDSVWLATQVLMRLAGHPTRWPVFLLTQRRAHLGVPDLELEGALDVEFAGRLTRETGRLILFPFLIQFLMLASRTTYFDNWGWPANLVFIFLCNILLAVTGWMVLRRAAAKVRSASLDGVKERLLAARQAGDQRRVHALEAVREQINRERYGAYARFFQDPALLAVLIPTGLLGILTMVFRALFGGV